ncbi:LOW QUALITY PROTEIN: A disintegrin and metalloproteinase with thrombospondin motifs 15 [Bufo gargarizans]|uniref:LOW QUALITY PROTEIN: A disintegrin and metalloproteinase with thrombospondin motifs 15 n=1 Tax=Bufo gargarizans TaxID=30331 RepID=UPI001CF3B8FA|nr:LOW QUALITY PROTEIN: A disintegrin and metalloproteinase with thrombospondin motifs 15 [Bufo gargarizans]
MHTHLAVTLLLALDLLLLQSTSLGHSPDGVLVTPKRLDPDINGRHYFKEGNEQTKDTGVIFQISAFQEDFYLNLSPDSQFIAPAFSMHFPGAHPKPSPSVRHCFYSGDVNSDRDSFAALSLCGGLRGAFGYQGVEYFISPLKNSTLDQVPGSQQGPHLLQKRRAIFQSSDTTSRCGVSSALNHGIMEALQRYKGSKHHRSHVNGTSRPRGGHRSRRFASITRYVETLVVADESMLKFHGDDLQHYLLTLMATAARLYRHHSIQNPINIAVVKFMVLTDDGKGPKVTTNAAMTLRSFCAWQRKWNKVSDKHPEYWDTAILFTKQDLCGASTCDTLGMADVGTMCDPKRSCSVIEDDGLPSAFTTAHELGHVFNMPHDNVKACEEVFGKLKENHMMSPTLIQIDRANPWSGCSAAIITDFLDNGHGECLLDEPAKPISLPDELPGVSYNLNRQCELAFGLGSKPCPYMQYCTKLWCTGRARGQLVCQTRHFPWADGTSCGDGKFCLNGACVERHNTKRYKVDGSWGKWSLYGQCSRTCGGGVQLAKRECNNPEPSHGGAYCEGLRVKYRSCSLNPCPDTGKSFREEQCEAFNGFNQSTNRLMSTVGWVPKYSGVSPRDKCKLICRANGTGYFYVLAPKVVDGTLCAPDSTSVCVQGKCIKAGCDGQLGSKKKYDKCRVCGGDNKSCKKISGLFTKPIHGYNFVVTVPAGASNLDVRQRGYKGLINDDNYLAVKNGQGRYLLNGNYIVSAVERDILIRGSLLKYTGTGTAVEGLQAVGVIHEPLTIEVLCVGKMTPPRLRYSFFIPREKKDSKTVQIISNSLTALAPPPPRPRPQSHWTAGSWGSCSVSCGDGQQTRIVECRDPWEQLSSDCPASLRPPEIRTCGDPCPIWETGEWTVCSKTCGRGFKRRQLRCSAGGGVTLPREHCTLKRKPQELDFCILRPC